MQEKLFIDKNMRVSKMRGNSIMGVEDSSSIELLNIIIIQNYYPRT